MSRFLWTLLRFCLAAWIGAAALFVVAGVREITSTEFDAATKNLLAAIRFPPYYFFGFSLVTVAAIASAILAKIESGGFRRQMLILPLIVLTLLVMAYDYQFVYLPLEEMMLAPAGTVTLDFTTYHQWSKYINAVSVSICLVAALLACAGREATDKPSSES